MNKSTILAAIVAAAALTFSTGAASDESVNAARDLYSAGLMKGNSNTFSIEAMELDRPATRTEIAITITRLLGKEAKALYQQHPHPFTDVPDWADAHIGWLYENYLVNGVSDTLFGSEEIATTRQFCTMLLRVLGYSEAKGDFSYSNATEIALDIGLIGEEQAQEEILYRSNMALISRNALQQPLRNANRTLSQKLREDRAITKEQFDLLNPVQQSELDAFFTDYPENVANGRAYYDDDKIVIQMDDNIGSFGLRVFYTSDSSPMPIELPIENSDFGFVKGNTVSPFGWYEKVTTFNIYGLNNETNLKFKVVNSSSEGVIYTINGVSPIIDVREKSEWTPYEVSLEDFFDGYNANVSDGFMLRDKSGVVVHFDDPVSYFGIRVVYTSDQTTFPKELPIENSEYGFTKGAPDWSINGKIHDLTLHGLENETNLQICVVETSSEGDIYDTYGVSPVITEMSPEEYTLDTMFSDIPEMTVSGRAYFEGYEIVLAMEEDIGLYGLRLFYTSDESPLPSELPINSSDYVGYTKAYGKSPFKWQQNITVFSIYGLEDHHNIKLKIANCTSESEIYAVKEVSKTFEVGNIEDFEPYTVSFREFFQGIPKNVSDGTLTRNDSSITVTFDEPVLSYGLRIVYISDQTTVPTELPIEDNNYGFVKGEPDWSVGGRIHELEIYGLDDETNVDICVIESSSESEPFTTLGISPSIEE